MAYRDLREFMAQLEQLGELVRVTQAVSPHLEMTALCDRSLRAGGPALLFENPTGHRIPVLGNLFGSTRRVALGMGVSDISEMRKFGQVLASLKEPEAPRGFKEFVGLGSMVKTLWNMAPKELRSAACQDLVLEGSDVDLGSLPIQHCWPGDVAPLITWGLVITKGPNKARQNLGIYRQQVLARNKVIMRWLPQRGGALDFREHGIARPGEPYPVCVALGADPATILGAVTPVPDSLSEYQFAGLLRGSRTELVKAIGSDDTARVMTQMKKTPINDFFAKNGVIRADGRMVHDMYLLQVKKPSESTTPWDYYNVRATIPAAEAFQPLSASTCPLIKK